MVLDVSFIGASSYRMEQIDRIYRKNRKHCRTRTGEYVPRKILRENNNLINLNRVSTKFLKINLEIITCLLKLFSKHKYIVRLK